MSKIIKKYNNLYRNKRDTSSSSSSSSGSDSDNDSDYETMDEDEECDDDYDEYDSEEEYEEYETEEDSRSESDEDDDEHDDSSDEKNNVAKKKKGKVSGGGGKRRKDKNKKNSKGAKKSAAAAAEKSPSKKKQRKSKNEESDSSNESDSDNEKDCCGAAVKKSQSSAAAASQKIPLFIFNSIVDGGEGADFDDFFEEDEYYHDTKQEDYTSEDERTFMKENYEKVVEPENVKLNTEKKNKDKKDKKKSKRRTSENSNESSSRESEPADDTESSKNAAKQPKLDVRDEYKQLLELKKHLLENLESSPNSKVLHNAIRDCNKEIKKLIKTTRNENTNHYIKLLKKETQNKTGEIEFFKKKLSNKEQLRVMEELTEINNHIFVEKPYRLALLEKQMPAKFKSIAYQKLNILKEMDTNDNEYFKIKNWVDTFMRIPFGVYRSLNVSINDGVDVCHDFISRAKETLDNCVYGHTDAKMQILQMAGQWISNPASMGTAIAIKGPAGTGKTTIIKDGISKIFGREFAFIPLGGATDSSYLEGHSYTYEGSQWGRIVQILVDGKTMNPVIFFDELDKVSDTPRGEEIINVLMHLTDTTQNSQFHDKYFSEIDFDLSKCLFIFSYNDENKISPILRDRMYAIHTKGYESKDKLIIARKYLLPKIREQVNFTEDEIIIPDDVIQYIISNQEMTKNEEGVRNLKRCLETIYTKLNLYRLVKPGTDILQKDINLQVSFPYTVTRNSVDILIRNADKTQNQSLLAMYV